MQRLGTYISRGMCNARFQSGNEKTNGTDVLKPGKQASQAQKRPLRNYRNDLLIGRTGFEPVAFTLKG
jgi:hypothetical protein